MEVQPPQSPDLNANDLGFLSSLQSQVDAKRVATMNWDKEKLVKTVRQTWREYDPRKLEQIFDSKSRIIQCVIDEKGSNEFDVQCTP